MRVFYFFKLKRSKILFTKFYNKIKKIKLNYIIYTLSISIVTNEFPTSI